MGLEARRKGRPCREPRCDKGAGVCRVGCRHPCGTGGARRFTDAQRQQEKQPAESAEIGRDHAGSAHRIARALGALLCALVSGAGFAFANHSLGARHSWSRWAHHISSDPFARDAIGGWTAMLVAWLLCANLLGATWKAAAAGAALSLAAGLALLPLLSSRLGWATIPMVVSAFVLFVAGSIGMHKAIEERWGRRWNGRV